MFMRLSMTTCRIVRDTPFCEKDGFASPYSLFCVPKASISQGKKAVPTFAFLAHSSTLRMKILIPKSKYDS